MLFGQWRRILHRSCWFHDLMVIPPRSCFTRRKVLGGSNQLVTSNWGIKPRPVGTCFTSLHFAPQRTSITEDFCSPGSTGSMGGTQHSPQLPFGPFPSNVSWNVKGPRCLSAFLLKTWTLLPSPFRALRAPGAPGQRGWHHRPWRATLVTRRGEGSSESKWQGRRCHKHLPSAFQPLNSGFRESTILWSIYIFKGTPNAPSWVQGIKINEVPFWGGSIKPKSCYESGVADRWDGSNNWLCTVPWFSSTRKHQGVMIYQLFKCGLCSESEFLQSSWGPKPGFSAKKQWNPDICWFFCKVWSSQQIPSVFSQRSWNASR